MYRLKYIILWLACALLLTYGVSYVYESSHSETAAQGEMGTGRNVCIYENGEYQVVDVEEYVSGVLAGMMSEDWNDEMLRVVAVIVRTGIYYQMDAQTVQAVGESDKDLINESSLREIRYNDEALEQMWGTGYGNIKAKAKTAAAATRGEVMTYGDNIIMPAYHMVSTGHTVSAEEIYGYDIPYLRQVDSDVDTLSDDFSTTNVYSADRLRKTFQSWIDGASTESIKSSDSSAESDGIEGKAISDDDAVRVTQATQSGYAKKICVYGAEIEADIFKTQLGLQSTNIHIDRVEDGYRIITIGVGDSLGLSLYGAAVLSQNGQTYEQILKYYYNGINISNNFH